MTEEQAREVQEDDRSIKKMEDFTSPDELYQELVKSVMRYHPSTDLSMIEKAYQVAKAAHKDQVRKSGEPYIIHPLYVAIILAELEMDKETIVAGLLHDVVEDTVMTDEEIKEYLAGNLCRCSGYEGQLRGIRAYLDWKKQREEDAQ